MHVRNKGCINRWRLNLGQGGYMVEGIDVAWLGMRLHRIRKQRGLTLQKVADKTGITVATLSRIERGGAKSLESSTLIALSQWMGIPAEKLAGKAKPVTNRHTSAEETPDIVELHLRADKNLTKETATALASLFRTAYEHYKQLHKKKE